jgi:hypothetical protein
MSEALALRNLQREFARSVTDPDADVAGSVSRVRSDRGIPAEERIAVYVHGYFARLHGVLREDYGALAEVLGEDAFHDLVRLYLMAHPPRTFSLRFAGERLPAFLAGPIAEPFARRWSFAADLAALEWALVEVFDAPDAPLLSRAALAAVQPDAWPALRFALAPAHRMLSLAWPVGLIREAWSAGLPLPAPEARPTRVLVYRSGDAPYQRSLSSAEARALQLVADRRDFAAICAGVADELGEERAAPQLLEWLERWLADGILAGEPPTD